MGRDSNPRWSCPHNGFQDRRNRPLCHPSETVLCAGPANRRFCSPFAPGGAAHHSFALDCAGACLADSYARPSQSTALPPIRNCFMRRSCKPTVLFVGHVWRRALFYTIFYETQSQKSPRRQQTLFQTAIGPWSNPNWSRTQFVRQVHGTVHRIF